MIILTDNSGTLTTGGTAQDAIPRRAGRQTFAIANPGTLDLWVSFTGTAGANAAGSFKLAAGAIYEAPSNAVSDNPVSVFGATTGQPFTAWQG